MTNVTSFPPLFILLASDDHNRAHVAFSLSLAALALGREVTLFAGGKSVRLLGKLRADCESECCPEGSGVLCLDKLIEESVGLGARLIACETGLFQTNLKETDLIEGVQVGGMVGLLAEVGSENMMVF
ncbi:hypothetical protein FAI41_01175 [Acetobacteraceae bacterium]|nr:hypothetical protein FAI41_01175 [Acetobacteraceae bacterium]